MVHSAAMRNFNLLNSALIWLILLAIPTQGFAAAVAVYCGLGHQGAGAASIRHDAHGVAKPAAEHASTARLQPPRHAGHEHAQVASSEESFSASAMQAVAVQTDLPPKSTCSACADCSSGAAIMISVVKSSSGQGSPAPASWAPAPRHTFLTDGPERPPRPILA